MTVELGIEPDFPRPGDPDYFMPESMGPGCAVLDYDGDGRLDIYVVRGHRNDRGDTEASLGVNRLYRQGTDGCFTDVTTEAGVGDPGYGMGVAVGDIDNDGFPDVFVTNYGANRLYRNQGDGTFQDITHEAGLETTAWSASAGFFDFDRDGLLDLYVTNYLAYDPSERGRDAAGRPEYPPPSVFPGAPDELYRNVGNGRFLDVSESSGIASRAGRGLGVVFTDLDGNGWIDVYVANDGDPNLAWLNDGTGRFTENARPMGIALNGLGQVEAGMGVALGDYDGDGDRDFLVTHLVQESHTLYRQVSPGVFEDATRPSGLGPPTVDLTGFGTVFMDVELDGDLDLVCLHGRVLRRVPRSGVRLNQHWAPYAEPDELFVNDGTGLFRAAGARAGALTNELQVGRGLACGDLDEDGDIDLVITNANGTVRVLRNDAQREGHGLVVRAVDPRWKRDALGSVVTVVAGERQWRREVTPVRSYLSSCDARVHFGLGDTPAIDEIRVRWPDGQEERFPGGPVRGARELIRGKGQ